MVNFSLLVAEIISLVWGTPANFNGFRVLASLLQRRRSMEANHTFHNVWPLPRLIDYIYIFGGCCSITDRILPGAKFSLHPPSLALSYWQHYCTAVEQWARAKLCGVEYRAPPVFGRATITLGIGPHSSCILYGFCVCLCVTLVSCGCMPKWIELVFGVKVATEDSYFVLNEGLDLIKKERWLCRTYKIFTSRYAANGYPSSC